MRPIYLFSEVELLHNVFSYKDGIHIGIFKPTADFGASFLNVHATERLPR